MTTEEFTALVARLEARAQEYPRAYQARILLLALLGYVYILAALGVALLLSLVHPALFLGVGLPLAFLVFRALWIRVPVPQGVPIESQDAPRLFRAVEHIRERLNFPRFHRLLVVDDFNAGVNQVPRLGLLGWHRNYLLLGLPLLMGL